MTLGVFHVVAVRWGPQPLTSGDPTELQDLLPRWLTPKAEKVCWLLARVPVS